MMSILMISVEYCGCKRSPDPGTIITPKGRPSNLVNKPYINKGCEDIQKKWVLKIRSDL